MSLEIIHEIWAELKTHMAPPDKIAAANDLVAILVDHDYEAPDIKEEFSEDPLIRDALEPYLDTDSEEEEQDNDKSYESYCTHYDDEDEY